MDASVACCAESNKVLLRVITRMAPEFFVMDSKFDMEPQD
jgi:hypothetical protein